ncbi:MAG: ABC transporter substrate-binding protein [Tistlia sp.]|uniref:ABC transporter substrate-binding protein n=1 Tax=Tistlia sp. TaxID=3057121 RepID=UPI0034A1DDEF
MSKLRLSVAIGDYDRNRALLDGRVQIDGVDPVFMTLSPEEIFFRAFRHREFDICELSFSSYLVTVDKGDPAYVAIPAFLSRAFRHTSIYVRDDKGIERPEDLKGKRIGLAEYQLSANVWARALLEDDHGVRPSDVTWVRGGMETPGRPEKIPLQLPPEIRLEQAPEGRSLNALLAEGEIDGFMGPRTLSCFDQGHPKVRRLFRDPTSAAADYYRRSGIFPIMHLLGLRREIAEAQPWLPAALLKAFGRSKAAALALLSDTSATKVTLPFVEEQLAAARALMGEDYWSYGVAGNRPVLENFLDHHHRQGLSKRRLTIEEIFHPATLEAHSI